MIQFANLERVRRLARTRTAAVLLACAILFLSVLAMHAPLITARSMRHLSSASKMISRAQATDLAVAPVIANVEAIVAFVFHPAPRRAEPESPAIPISPTLGATSLRAPPLA